MKKTLSVSAALPAIIIAALILCLALLPYAGKAEGAVGDVEANMQLTYRMDTPNVEYYNAQEGCTYRFSFYEYEDQPLDKVYYSVYQVMYKNETITDGNGGYVNDVVIYDNVRQENIVVPKADWQGEEEYDPYTGRRLCGFKVTVHEWSAIVVKVDWTEGGETQTAVFDGADGSQNFPVYCTNIDCSAPYMKFVDGPIYINKSFQYTVQISANTSDANSIRSARSRFKSIRVFRKLTEDGEEETISEITSFNSTNQMITAVDVYVERGAYYITAVDGVGNSTTMKVGQVDYDIDEIVRINSTETILAASESYTDELITPLSKTYYAYLAIKNDKSATEIDVSEAQRAYETALSAVLKAQKEKDDGTAYSYEIINGESYGGVTAENFDADSLPTVRVGDTAKLLVSLASFNVADMDSAIRTLPEASEGANKALAISLSVSTASKGSLTPYIFPEAVEISVPMSQGYGTVAAYAKVERNGTVSYEKLSVTKKTDSVTIDVKNSNAKIYFLYEQGSIESDKEESGNKKLLWLLVLLVLPVGAGVLAFCFYRKKKKRN